MTARKSIEFAIVCCLLIRLIRSGTALRMTDIQLPSIAIFGKPAQLNCTYELGQDQLYSIKWFFNDQEFYRYLPNDNPPEQFYHTKGLYVDLTKSSKSLVHLRKVDLRTDGLFRVEVSAEAPSFQTVRKEKYLNVYFFPREAPIVRLKNRTSDLRVNDVLDVTCQSGPARPATKLQFFINDTPISQAYANLTESVSPIVLDDGEETGDLPKPIDLNSELNSIDYSNDIGGLQAGPQNGLVLFNSTLRLQIRLRQSLLKARKTVNLRCASYVTHLFTKTSEHVFTVVKDEPPADLSRAFSRKKNSFFRNFNRKTFGPFIDNTRSNYAIGELINVTCFTGSSKPPAFLQWFIGNREAPAEYLRVYKPVETKDGGLRSMLGLEFRLTEQFLADQQPTAQTTSTVQPFAESDGRTDTYSTFQDLGDPVDQQANQTIRLANRKREIKLRCSAQLSRIVHVRTRQFSLSSDQSRLEAAQNSASSSSGLLDGLFKFYAILVLFLFAAPCMCFV